MDALPVLYFFTIVTVLNFAALMLVFGIKQQKVLQLKYGYKILGCSALLAVIYCYCANILWLSDYYSEGSNILRKQNKIIRPMVARLSRELIKAELSIKPDQANIPLILEFASVQAHLNNGVVGPELSKLLSAILRVEPNNTRALALLAGKQ